MKVLINLLVPLFVVDAADVVKVTHKDISDSIKDSPILKKLTSLLDGSGNSPDASIHKIEIKNNRGESKEESRERDSKSQKITFNAPSGGSSSGSSTVFLPITSSDDNDGPWKLAKLDKMPIKRIIDFFANPPKDFVNAIYDTTNKPATPKQVIMIQKDGTVQTGPAKPKKSEDNKKTDEETPKAEQKPKRSADEKDEKEDSRRNAINNLIERARALRTGYETNAIEDNHQHHKKRETHHKHHSHH